MLIGLLNNQEYYTSLYFHLALVELALYFEKSTTDDHIHLFINLNLGNLIFGVFEYRVINWLGILSFAISLQLIFFRIVFQAESAKKQNFFK